MEIEVRHLRYVIASAESGSFRRAARALNVEQSAVSRHIRDLEDRIGAALFTRHPGGARLTLAGEHFLVSARRVVSQIRDAATDAASFGQGKAGTIRIGICFSFASGFFADLLRLHIAQNPTVRFDIVEDTTGSHIDAVQRQHLDIAFLLGEQAVDGCEVRCLWNERVFVALPSHHALAAKSEVSLGDLRGQHFIMRRIGLGPELNDYLAKHLAELAYHPSVEWQAVERDNLMQLIAMGQGLTLTSEATTEICLQGVVYRSLMGQMLPYSAIWSRRNENPALKLLLQLAEELVRSRQSDAEFEPQRTSMDWTTRE